MSEDTPISDDAESQPSPDQGADQGPDPSEPGRIGPGSAESPDVPEDPAAAGSPEPSTARGAEGPWHARPSGALTSAGAFGGGTPAPADPWSGSAQRPGGGSTAGTAGGPSWPAPSGHRYGDSPWAAPAGRPADTGFTAGHDPGYGAGYGSSYGSAPPGAASSAQGFPFAPFPPLGAPSSTAHTATASGPHEADHGHGGPVRTVLIAVAIAALALVAGLGGGVLGSSLAANNADNTSGGSGSAIVQHTTGQSASDTSPAPAGSVQQVAAKVLPSVVSVVAVAGNAQSEGSGIVLTSSGLILTNEHVIDGASKLTVQFNDGTTANATVVGADPTDDLAVIKVSGMSGLTPATLGSSSNLQVGQQVVAVGSPLGLSATVTTGIVSALNRPVRTSQAQSEQAQGTVLNAIQTDAAINPGNSGGPLVDMNGYVIGINSAIAALSSGSNGQSGSIGVGFAIPIDQAHRIAQEIIDTGKASHAVLGASVTDNVDQSRGVTTGAKIADITPNSGAAKAGLQAGDVVTKVGGTLIESADALVATIRSTAPGSKVTVTYLRGGQPATVDVTLGSVTN